MYYGRCYICTGQTLCVHSPDGSTFLREMTSWPPHVMKVWLKFIENPSIPTPSIASHLAYITWRTFLPNFIPIRFETTELWAFLKTVAPYSAMQCHISYPLYSVGYIRLSLPPVTLLSKWQRIRYVECGTRPISASWDIERQMYPGRDLDLSGSRDVIDHEIIWFDIIFIVFPTGAPLKPTFYLQRIFR